MFSLALVTDSIRIHPRTSQSSSLLHSVFDSLNARFCNRVLTGVGLVLRVFDVVELEEPIIHSGESHSSVKGKRSSGVRNTDTRLLAKFRLVVFKPFVGEVLIGKIRSCTEEGLSISLTFFDDIFIPAHCLQPGTTFNAQERLWVWNYDGNELFMDLDEPVRFRVLSLSFSETAPVQKEALLAAVANKMQGIGEVGKQEQELAGEVVQGVPPFKICGTVAEDGLGLLSWWS